MAFSLEQIELAKAMVTPTGQLADADPVLVDSYLLRYASPTEHTAGVVAMYGSACPPGYVYDACLR